METLQDKLIAARDSLIPENWRKSSYFQFQNNHLCMCAHGALQAQVNPVIRELLTEGGSYLPIHAAISGNARADRAKRNLHAEISNASREGAWKLQEMASVQVGIELTQDQSDIWKNRPYWVKDRNVNGTNEYGNVEAHYLLGMVGLTVQFNDAKETTLDMVKEKFSEAIALAKELGV